jgi:adenylate cyclase
MSTVIRELELKAYLPTDRYQSLVEGRTLPETASGALLFADIVGFTPLTESLVEQLGARQGAEELTRYLNIVYSALIAQVHRYGGSVIYFSGDAITCWFAGDEQTAIHRAGTAAFALQKTVARLEPLDTARCNPIGIKISLASGQVRRFVVGDPAVQLFDVIAGQPLERLAHVEQVARTGEILATPEVIAALAGIVTVAEWRELPHAEFAAGVLSGLTMETSACEWEFSPVLPALRDELRSWLLPAVARSLEHGLEDFLTELRPAVALFMRFNGLDFVGDSKVGVKLDDFIRQVQNILQELGGNLIQLTVGEKGSYLYAAFGAPVAHQNDAERAIAAARRLLATRPSHLTLNIGLSYGTMRTGAYGCPDRATFGVLGDEVNLAARLMIAAPANSALFSSRLHKMLTAKTACRKLPPLQVKGKVAPVGVYELLAESELVLNEALPINSATYQMSFIGRTSELDFLSEKIRAVQSGNAGQLVAIMGEAGLGKSRLVAELCERLPNLRCYRAEGQSYATSSPYRIWQPIFRALLKLNVQGNGDGGQIERLKVELKQLGVNSVARLPLLGALLGLNLPDNEFTARLEPDLRKNLLEALALELLGLWAGKSRGTPVIVLENCQWLDPLSQSLLAAVSGQLSHLPVLLLLTYRVEPGNAETEFLAGLPGATHLRLQGLSDAQMQELLAHKIAHVGGQKIDPENELHLVKRVEGNPFYLEELINVLFADGQTAASDPDELPDSLHGLILSHLDMLNDSEKAVLKVASVIGRVFTADWLREIEPRPLQLEQTLQRLVETNLIAPQPDEPGGYAFRHGLTQEITYQSLLGAHKGRLHEAVGCLLEQKSGAGDLPVDLLAYHFGRSPNATKQRRYWRLAGQQAQAGYANQTALHYYSQLIELLDKQPFDAIDTMREWFEVSYQFSRVLHSVGRWQEGEKICRDALNRLANLTFSEDWVGEKRVQYELLLCSHLIGLNQWSGARQWAEKVRQNAPKSSYEAQALSCLGWITLLQDDYEAAIAYLEQSLVMFRELDDLTKIASCLKNLGVAMSKMQRWENARQYMEEGLQIYRQLADRQGIAATLDALATVVNDHLGELDKAQVYLEESLELNRSMGNRRAMAFNLNNLGVIADRRGDYEAAYKFYEAHLVLRRDLNDPNGLVLALYNIGMIAINHLRDLALAEKYYEEALHLSQTHDYKFGRAIALAGLGCVRYLQQDYTVALAKLYQTLNLCLEIKARSYARATLVLIATVLVASAEAESELARAARIYGCLEAHAAAGGVLDTLLDTPAYNVYATTLQKLQTRLDKATFEKYFAEGQKLDLTDKFI